jgi:hypothetical protein
MALKLSESRYESAAGRLSGQRGGERMTPLKVFFSFRQINTGMAPEAITIRYADGGYRRSACTPARESQSALQISRES